MKVLCPACERLLPLEHFAVDGGALVVTCAKCGHQARATVPAEGAAPPAAVLPASGTDGAPRDGGAPGRAPLPTGAPTLAPPRVALASQPGASNVVVLRTAGHDAIQKAAAAADDGPFRIPEGMCPRCLAIRGEAPSCAHCGITFESFDDATALPEKWLRDEWVELLRDWGNQTRHAAYRRRAQQADALVPVARLYRMRQAWVPEDPIAEEGRADILRLAQVSLAFRPSQEGAERTRRFIIGGAVVLLLTLLGVVLYQIVTFNRPPLP